MTFYIEKLKKKKEKGTITIKDLSRYHRNKMNCIHNKSIVVFKSLIVIMAHITLLVIVIMRLLLISNFWMINLFVML